MIATWHVCVFAGALFALLARTPFPGLAIKITSAQLAPYLAIGAAIALLTSHRASRIAQKNIEEKLRIKYLDVPEHFQAGWEACNIRNSSGYKSIGTCVQILSVMILAARAGLFRI